MAAYEMGTRDKYKSISKCVFIYILYPLLLFFTGERMWVLSFERKICEVDFKYWMSFLSSNLE